jgi:ankyrin repeat protein
MSPDSPIASPRIRIQSSSLVPKLPLLNSAPQSPEPTSPSSNRSITPRGDDSPQTNAAATLGLAILHQFNVKRSSIHQDVINDLVRGHDSPRKTPRNSHTPRTSYTPRNTTTPQNTSPLTLLTPPRSNETSDTIDSARGDSNTTNQLNHAARNGDISRLLLLLDSGVDSNTPGRNGWTPLHFASQGGHTDIVSILAERSDNIDAKEKNKSTALLLAANNGFVEIIRILQRYGADLEARNEEGFTSLLLTVRASVNSGPVHALCELGADLEAKDNNEWTALHWAVFNDSDDLIKILCEFGANIDALNGEKETPLMMACKTGNLKIAKRLMKYAPSLTLRNKEGKTALELAEPFEKLVKMIEKQKEELLSKLYHSERKHVAQIRLMKVEIARLKMRVDELARDRINEEMRKTLSPGKDDKVVQVVHPDHFLTTLEVAFVPTSDESDSKIMHDYIELFDKVKACIETSKEEYFL